MKKRWNVYGKVHATKYLGEFEADSAEEAERMAMESDAASICVCHQCADEVSDPEIEGCVVEEELSASKAGGQS